MAIVGIFACVGPALTQGCSKTVNPDGTTSLKLDPVKCKALASYYSAGLQGLKDLTPLVGGIVTALDPKAATLVNLATAKIAAVTPELDKLNALVGAQVDAISVAATPADVATVVAATSPDIQKQAQVVDAKYIVANAAVADAQPVTLSTLPATTAPVAK